MTVWADVNPIVIESSVVYREGPITTADYDEAIEALVNARRQLVEMNADKGWNCCYVCEDSHPASMCHHNPLVMARLRADDRQTFRCYHCDFVARTFEEAAEHFGEREEEVAKCLQREAAWLPAVVRGAYTFLIRIKGWIHAWR